MRHAAPMSMCSDRGTYLNEVASVSNFFACEVAFDMANRLRQRIGPKTSQTLSPSESIANEVHSAPSGCGSDCAPKKFLPQRDPSGSRSDHTQQTGDPPRARPCPARRLFRIRAGDDHCSDVQDLADLHRQPKQVLGSHPQGIRLSVTHSVRTSLPRTHAPLGGAARKLKIRTSGVGGEPYLLGVCPNAQRARKGSTSTERHVLERPSPLRTRAAL